MNIRNIQETLGQDLTILKNAPYIYIHDLEARPEIVQQLLNEIENVERLSISNYWIEVFPDLSKLTTLKNIQFSCPMMATIPKENLPHSCEILIINGGLFKEMPEEIWRINNLTTFSLLKNEKLEKVKVPSNQLNELKLDCLLSTEVIFETEQHSLYWFQLRSTCLKELDSSFDYLKNLKQIQILAPIQKVNCNFSGISKLETVTFGQWEISSYEFLKNIIDLKRLNISQSKTRWSGLPDIQQWKELETLNLDKCTDSKLTKAVFENEKLRYVHLHECQFSDIPRTFSTCQNLQTLSLTSYTSISFSDCFEYLPMLKSLILTQTPLEDFHQVKENEVNWQDIRLINNNATFSNLDFLDYTPNLRSFAINQNAIESVKVLLRKNPIPLFTEHNIVADSKFQDVQQLSKIASNIAKSKLAEVDKIFFLNYLASQRKLSVDKKWNWNILLKATNISYPPFRKLLTTLIDKKIENAKNKNPLTKESVLFISGKTKAKKTDLKNQAKELGIQLVSKYSPEVTHIIIGMNSMDADLIEEHPFTPLNANDLQRIHADSQPQFLKDEVDTEQNPEVLSNLGNLLVSPEIVNVKVGLEMIKNGGLPPELFEPLLVLQKTTTDSKVRKDAKELLEIHAPIEWKTLIADRLSFKAVNNSTKFETDIRKQFKSIAKRITPTLAGKFSCMMFRQKERGLRYALTAGLKKEVKKEAYQLLLKDNHFDFSKGLGYRERIINPHHHSYYTLLESSVALPVLALELDSIHSLNLTNCRYNSLSEKITKFKDLKHLNLSINELISLPDYFAELKKLETIDFSYNRFKSFPTILLQLPNLKKVIFTGNEKFEIPKDFKCTIM